MKTILLLTAAVIAAIPLTTVPAAAQDKPVIALSNSFYGNTWRRQMVDAFTAQAEKAKAGAERLRRAVQDFSWKTGSMTISIGIITANPDDNEATLLQKADEALYASKQNGRNQVTHYDDLRLRGYSH